MLCIRNTILALLAGLLIGGVAGFYTKGKFVKAEAHEKVAERRKEDANAFTDMQAQEAALQAHLDETRTNTDATLKWLDPKLRHQPGKEASAQACPDPIAGADLVLDARTVGLLNAARANKPFDPAAWGDAKGKAAAAATRNH